jgi:hypothetical protein
LPEAASEKHRLAFSAAYDGKEQQKFQRQQRGSLRAFAWPHREGRELVQLQKWSRTTPARADKQEHGAGFFAVPSAPTSHAVYFSLALSENQFHFPVSIPGRL